MELSKTQREWLAKNRIRVQGEGFAKGHWTKGLQYDLEQVDGTWELSVTGLCTACGVYAPRSTDIPVRKFETLKAGLACLRELEVR